MISVIKFPVKENSVLNVKLKKGNYRNNVKKKQLFKTFSHKEKIFLKNILFDNNVQEC